MSTTREQLLQALEEENRKSNAEGVLFFQALADRSGMHLTDLLCTVILTSTGPVTAGRLAELTGLTTGAITGVVNRMERAGYVRRDKDPDDARRVVIRPVVEELERVEPGFFGSHGRLMDELLSDYDDAFLSAFLEIMRTSNSMTREATTRLRASSKGEDKGEFAAPLGMEKRGRLVFANGVSRLTLRSASEMEDLYQARFEGVAPQVTTNDGTVTFRYPGRLKNLFTWHSRSGAVAMADAVPWEIEVRGGAYRVDADLAGLQLTSFTLKGGISDCDIMLPMPAGVVTVRLAGGASNVRMRRPAGVDVELSVKGGAGKLTLDDMHFDAVGGKVRLESSGFSRSTDRYAIEISGGASEISIK